MADHNVCKVKQGIRSRQSLILNPLLWVKMQEEQDLFETSIRFLRLLSNMWAATYFYRIIAKGNAEEVIMKHATIRHNYFLIMFCA